VQWVLKNILSQTLSISILGYHPTLIFKLLSSFSLLWAMVCWYFCARHSRRCSCCVHWAQIPCRTMLLRKRQERLYDTELGYSRATCRDILADLTKDVAWRAHVRCDVWANSGFCRNSCLFGFSLLDNWSPLSAGVPSPLVPTAASEQARYWTECLFEVCFSRRAFCVRCAYQSWSLELKASCSR